jgi:hypothetical protein
MTDLLIQQQKEDIRAVLSDAAKSKSAALKFLTSAGLIEPEKGIQKNMTTNKKKKAK